jgi:hypothetical protein
MTDPWAAAAQASTGQQQNTSTTAQDALMPATPDPDGAERALMGGQSVPSMFNKSHGLNDDVTGVITELPTQKQSRFYAEGAAGALKYWSESANKPTEDAVDRVTGRPNNPLYDTVVKCATEYRKPGDVEDEGLRAFYLAGNDLKAFRAAISVAKQAGIISSFADLVGLRVTGRRIGQVPTGKGNSAWTYAFKLERVA